MAVMLRISIASLFFIIGGLIIVYPNSTKLYVSLRVSKFVDLLNFFVTPSGINSHLISNISLHYFYGLGAFFVLSGLFTLINCSCLIFIVSFVSLLLGMALHIPYGGAMIRQTRKLATIGLMFFCAIILISSKCGCSCTNTCRSTDGNNENEKATKKSQKHRKDK